MIYGGGMVRRSRAREIAITVALLGTIIAPPAAAWAYWGDGSNPRVAALPVTVADPDRRRPYRVRQPDPIVSVPGAVVLDEQGLPEHLHAVGALSDAEFDMVMSSGMARAQALSTTDGDLSRSIWRYTARDGADPSALLRRFDRFFQINGWASDDQAGGRVRVWLSPPQDLAGPDPSATIRAHYVRGRDLLRVEAHGKDRGSVQAAWENLLTAQLDRFPADE